MRAELLVLRLDAMLTDIEQRDRTIAEQENLLQAAIAEQRNIEAEIEQQAPRTEANDAFNTIQGRFYAVGSRIARLEESIQYARRRGASRSRTWSRPVRHWAQATALSEQDGSRLAELAGELERDQPMPTLPGLSPTLRQRALHDAEAAMLAWQTNWDSFNQGANEPAQRAQVERTRINHLEQQEVQLKRRLTRNEEERGPCRYVAGGRDCRTAAS